jgi:hypothetical protein
MVESMIYDFKVMKIPASINIDYASLVVLLIVNKL